MTLTALRPASRLTGALYLTIAVLGGFAIGYVPSATIVPGDAAATAQGILAHPGLMRMGLAADMGVLACEILVTALLFTLFRPVAPALALAMTAARYLMVATMGLNMVLQAMALALLQDPSLAAVPAETREAFALLLDMGKGFGVHVWGVFFGLHLLLLGTLALHSGFVPKPLGALMAVGALGYLIEATAALVLPGQPWLATAAIPFLGATILGEVGFALWLLLRGIDPARWTPRAMPA